MMRDDKLVRVALQSKQMVERVLWVWGAILESAAEINDGGRFDFDPAEAAYFLRSDEGDIRAIIDALAAVQRLDGDRVVNWSARQFESDRSAPRQAAYRERKRAEKRDTDNIKTSGDGRVTSPSRHGDAPETKTEADIDKKEKRRSVADATRPCPEFEKFKEAYPKRGASNPWQPARQLFEQAVKSGHDPTAIIAAAKGYRQECERNRIVNTDKVAQAQTWLRQSRYSDYQAPAEEADKPIDWDSHVKFYKQVGRWPHTLGGEPGSLACRVPADILEQHGYARLHLRPMHDDHASAGEAA